MKVLFYLPVVTPWWFTNVVEPLIRRMASTAEVTVLAPKPWRGTGIGPSELGRCTDLSSVRWCIMDGDDHPSTRTKPKARTDLIDFVRSVDPDFVFCRSADVETPKSFPGCVRYLMEGGIAPFKLPDRWITLQEQPLEQGLLPDLDSESKARLAAAIHPAWSVLRNRHRTVSALRDAVRRDAGLPADRPVLLLPLDYEHEENFFLMHRVGPRPNHRLVGEVADAVGSDFILAVTDHPLNRLYVDQAPLEAAMAKLGGRAVLMPPVIRGCSATLALAPHVDGLIVHDSKAFALGPLCGTPLLRRSSFRVGEWVGAYADVGPFIAAVAAGTAASAAEEDARLWTAFHLANNAFDPQDPELTADDILDRAVLPVSPARWQAGLARARAATPELYQ